MTSRNVGLLPGLVFKVYKSSRDAQVNIYNCRILRYICVDLLRALHSAGIPEICLWLLLVGELVADASLAMGNFITGTDKIISVPPDVFLEVKGDLEVCLRFL